MMRTLSVLALTLGLLLAGGCVKVKQIVTVMPDGSGKIEFTFGVSQTAADQAGEDPFEEFTLEELLEEDGLPAGVVAATEPEHWEDGGYDYVRFTMYFEDIREFEIKSNGDLIDMSDMFAIYDFQNDGDGCTLTVHGGMINSLLANVGQIGPDELAMLRAEMAEFEGSEMVELYVLPGEASAIEGVTMEDNTADVTIDLDNIMNDDGTIESLQEAAPFVFEVDENTIAQETIDAFAAELAQAIEDWETLKEELGME